MIFANTNVEILAQDPGHSWYQIVYAQGVDRKGWVAALYVSTAPGAQIPVVGADRTITDHGSPAIVQEQINVRSGPGTNFNPLGTLNAQEVVSLTGKDANGTWLQIIFAGGPDGKGWINAAFVKAQGIESLPIISQAGEVVGTGTPAGIPSAPTPTVLPAWDDQDSEESPAASVVFESLGTNSLIYRGDVSTPRGDSKDWIQFLPYGSLVLISLECDGEDNLKVTLLANGQVVPAQVACGDRMSALVVEPGKRYSIELEMLPATDSLHYIQYILSVQSIQQ